MKFNIAHFVENCLTVLFIRVKSNGGFIMLVDQEPIIIYVTFGCLSNAKEVARKAIKAQMAACINIIPDAISFYEWEGNIEETSEVIMVIKTIKSCQDQLITFIKTHHDYEEPAIICLPIKGGSATYLKWAVSQIEKKIK